MSNYTIVVEGKNGGTYSQSVYMLRTVTDVMHRLPKGTVKYIVFSMMGQYVVLEGESIGMSNTRDIVTNISKGKLTYLSAFNSKTEAMDYLSELFDKNLFTQRSMSVVE